MNTRKVRDVSTQVEGRLADHDFGPPPVENFAAPVAHYGFMLLTRSGQVATEARFVRLPLPPQQIVEDEPTASTITPTLDGGMFIERRGNLQKHISLRGTTGNLPSANFAGTPAGVRRLGDRDAIVRNDTVNGDFALADLRVSEFGEFSGFAKFHELRDLFREYWATFKSADHTRQQHTRLFWIDPRDAEVWEVEPQRFRTVRARAYTRTYEIELKTIRPYSYNSVFEYDILAPLFTDPDPVQIKALAEDMQSFRDGLVAYTGLPSLPASARSAFSKIVEAIDNKVSSVVTLEAVSSWAGFSAFSDSVQDAYRIFQIAGTANEKFAGLHEAAIDSIRRATEWLAQPGFFGKQWWERWALLAARFTGWQDHVLAQFSSAYGADRTFTQAQQARKLLESEGFIPVTGGSDDIESVRQPLSANAYQSYNVEPDETVEELARRCAGDGSRAAEIIVANDLQYPYLVSNPDERRPGTLAPGDVVLVPVVGGSRQSVAPTATLPVFSFRVAVDSFAAAAQKIVVKNDPSWRVDMLSGYVVANAAGETRTLKANGADWFTISTPFDAAPEEDDVLVVRTPTADRYQRPGVLSALGQDVLLVSQPDGTYGARISQSGDIALVNGLKNAMQAINMFVEATPGDYPAHNERGVAREIGRRATPDAVFATEASVRTGLLNDPRFRVVDDLRLSLRGDVLSGSVRVQTVEGTITHTIAQPLR